MVLSKSCASPVVRKWYVVALWSSILNRLQKTWKNLFTNSRLSCVDRFAGMPNCKFQWSMNRFATCDTEVLDDCAVFLFLSNGPCCLRHIDFLEDFSGMHQESL